MPFSALTRSRKITLAALALGLGRLVTGLPRSASATEPAGPEGIWVVGGGDETFTEQILQSIRRDPGEGILDNSTRS